MKKKKFLTKLLILSVLIGGINFFNNFPENFKIISVASADEIDDLYNKKT